MPIKHYTIYNHCFDLHVKTLMSVQTQFYTSVTRMQPVQTLMVVTTVHVTVGTMEMARLVHVSDWFKHILSMQTYINRIGCNK